MMQDDSNSESTFEFVDDKKADDTLKSGIISATITVKVIILNIDDVDNIVDLF